MYSNENTREVLKLLDPRPGDVVLDVGCGESNKVRSEECGQNLMSSSEQAVVSLPLGYTLLFHPQVVHKARREDTYSGLIGPGV